MQALLDSLVAQRNNCHSDKCRVRGCKRCQRAEQWSRENKKESIFSRLKRAGKE